MNVNLKQKSIYKNPLLQKGFEFAAGIPGTLGGALAMNAGAYGGEMKQVVKTVRLMDRDGNIFELSNEEMKFEYRRSLLTTKDYIVLSAVIELQPGNVEEIKEIMADYSNRRSTKQPLNFPSAGSTFKRPEGHFAAKLIDDCGLRGLNLRGAQVSDKHCGFVINSGGATAKDILDLSTDIEDLWDGRIIKRPKILIKNIIHFLILILIKNFVKNCI